MTPSLEELRQVNPELAAQFEEQMAAVAAAVEEATRASKVAAADAEVSEAGRAVEEAENALNAARVRLEEAQAHRLSLDPVVEEAPVEETHEEVAPEELG